MDEETLRFQWAKTVADTGSAALDVGATYRPGASAAATFGAGPPGAAMSAAHASGWVAGIAPSSYALAGVLGQGGMGVVLRAKQSGLERPVALKRLHESMASEELRARFASEARVTALLEHPNVVPVHELVSLPGGELALSMKLVGGVPWSRLLHPQTDDEKKRAAALAAHDHAGHLEVLRSVCQAVAYAHAQGIVHRDLKPENVMVGEFGEVLLMDWGLAGETGEPRGIAEPVAKTEAPLG